MKSVSVEEVEQVQEDTFREFSKLVPALSKLPNPDDVSEIRNYYKGKQQLELHLIRTVSYYRLFIDRLNKTNDFQVFHDELFERHLQAYKDELAKRQDSGDFNEVK